MAIDVLTGMRVFTAVVDAGSFARAADKLDLSRGMTSRYVAQIEAHLGVRLLNRTTRRLSLTETGNDYYQRATQVLALVDEAEHAAADGLGVTVQPTFLVYELLHARKLIRVLEGWEADELTIFAVYASRQFLPPKVRTFIDFMVEHFGDNPYWDRGIA